MRLSLSRLWPFLLICLFTTLNGHPAFSASTPQLSLPELVRMAPTIVHGTVLETKSRWNDDHSLIVTEIRVAVSETLRGRHQPELVMIQPGGKVGKLRVDVDGAVTVIPGQEVVLFLAPGPEGGLTPVGLSRGSFKIETDARSGQKRVLNTASAGGVDLGGFLDDVRQKVRLLPKEGQH